MYDLSDSYGPIVTSFSSSQKLTYRARESEWLVGIIQIVGLSSGCRLCSGNEDVEVVGRRMPVVIYPRIQVG